MSHLRRRLVIKLNDYESHAPCPLCGELTAGVVGVQLMLDDTAACDACCLLHAPELVAALEAYRARNPGAAHAAKQATRRRLWG